MSKRKDVDDRAAASLSMPQPLIEGINPVNPTATDGPPSCENYILFRQGPLLPRITNPRFSRPSEDLFAKIPTPVTNPYRYKRANKAPYPLAGRYKNQRRFD
jgi:hypothetical protein